MFDVMPMLWGGAPINSMSDCCGLCVSANMGGLASMPRSAEGPKSNPIPYGTPKDWCGRKPPVPSTAAPSSIPESLFASKYGPPEGPNYWGVAACMSLPFVAAYASSSSKPEPVSAEAKVGVSINRARFAGTSWPVASIAAWVWSAGCASNAPLSSTNSLEKGPDLQKKVTK